MQERPLLAYHGQVCGREHWACLSVMVRAAALRHFTLSGMVLVMVLVVNGNEALVIRRLGPP